MPAVPPVPPPAFTRRRLLATSAASAAAATLPVTAAHAVPARPTDDSIAGQGFAMVTDTHQNLRRVERHGELSRIFEHIMDRDPAFVVNCGDLADFGVADEFAGYRSTIPNGLADRVHQVPGNHESQWNTDGFEAYRRLLGPAHYSFDAAGLHVIGLDPVVSQEWDFHFGAEVMQWLADDLADAPADTPIVIFSHFPLSNKWHYAMNAEELYEAIEPYPVRLLLSGHTHSQSLLHFNGLTQLVGDSTADDPGYYWFDRQTDDDGDRLVVTHVLMPPDGPVEEVAVTTVPLDEPGPGGSAGPVGASVEQAGGDTVRVDLQAPEAATVAYAQLWPQGAETRPFVELAATDPGRWSGEVDVSYLPPGEHRMALRTNDADGAWYDGMQRFTLPSDTISLGWEHAFGERVQADLAVAGDLVVGASILGEVAALRVGTDAAEPVWERTLGPVYKGSRFVADDSLIAVPSADHHLYGLDAETGGTSWSRDLGAPVMSCLSSVTVDDEEVLLAVAGSSLHCLGIDGSSRWSASIGGVSSGQVAGDGERVHIGAGNGYAYGFSTADGSQLWRTKCTTQTSRYGALIHGPWASRMRLLDDGGVIATTYTELFCLEPDSGEVRWSVKGFDHGSYTAPAVTPRGVLAVNGTPGTISLHDPATGETRWTADALPISNGAGLIPTEDPDVWWMAGNTGLLVRIDLAEQQVEQVFQISTAWSNATGVLVDVGGDPVLVAAAKDGRVRGVIGI